MKPDLLHYRAWRGPWNSVLWSPWPIARSALSLLLRRKMFWGLYGLSLFTFCLFFFGQYMLSWAEANLAADRVNVAGRRVNPTDLVKLFRTTLKLDAREPDIYCNFFWYQGYMVMVVLALAGAQIVGNDLQHGSLPFFLSKPVSRLHYVLGKALAIAVFVNMMTTLPAFVLFFQYGLLDTWQYYLDRAYFLLGIAAYGLVLTFCLSLLLVATATWVRRTVPLIMTWTTLFFFCRVLGVALVDRLNYPASWRLIDLWNNTYLVGSWFLAHKPKGEHPPVAWAAAVLVAVCSVCVVYLAVRIRAVEIVT